MLKTQNQRLAYATQVRFEDALPSFPLPPETINLEGLVPGDLIFQLFDPKRLPKEFPVRRVTHVHIFSPTKEFPDRVIHLTQEGGLSEHRLGFLKDKIDDNRYQFIIVRPPNSNLAKQAAKQASDWLEMGALALDVRKKNISAQWVLSEAAKTVRRKDFCLLDSSCTAYLSN